MINQKRTLRIKKKKGKKELKDISKLENGEVD